MQSTASDFWTMIWQKNCYSIVMLGQLEENDEVCSLANDLEYLYLIVLLGGLFQILAG